MVEAEAELLREMEGGEDGHRPHTAVNVTGASSTPGGFDSSANGGSGVSQERKQQMRLNPQWGPYVMCICVLILCCKGAGG